MYPNQILKNIPCQIFFSAITKTPISATKRAMGFQVPRRHIFGGFEWKIRVQDIFQDNQCNSLQNLTKICLQRNCNCMAFKRVAKLPKVAYERY